MIQFGCLGFILVTSRWNQLPLIVILFLFAAGVLALLAVAAMKIGNFNIVPAPVPGGKLVTRGPYRLIRHPMYSSLLLLAWGAFFKHFTIFGLGLVLLTSLFLYITGLMEEKENLAFFGPTYREYMKSTKMFLPFIL